MTLPPGDPESQTVVSPRSSDPALEDEPALEPRDDKPKRLAGPIFWVMIGFSAACIVAGAAVGFYGSHLLGAVH